MNPRRIAAGTAVAAAVLALAGCFAVGPQPEDAIPPALLESDLGILEASASTSTSGFSVSVVAGFVVERDAISADDLREVLAIVVDNTHITNIYSVVVYGKSDEIDPESITGSHVPLDLESPASELDLELRDGDGTGGRSIEAYWDDVLAMLEATS